MTEEEQIRIENFKKNAPFAMQKILQSFKLHIENCVNLEGTNLDKQQLLDVVEVGSFTAILEIICAEPNKEFIVEKLKRYMALLGDRMIQNMDMNGALSSILSASMPPAKKEDLN